MQPTEETWRPIPEGHGWYDASDLGRIRSWHSTRRLMRAAVPHLIRPRSHPGGYHTVSLCVDGAARSHTIHALVLSTFVGPRPQGHEGAHWNGDRSDNRLANLRWASPLENASDMLRHGNTSRGERHGQHVLTVEKVRYIRSSQLGVAALARELGVSEGAVRAVVDRRSWRWL